TARAVTESVSLVRIRSSIQRCFTKNVVHSHLCSRTQRPSNWPGKNPSTAAKRKYVNAKIMTLRAWLRSKFEVLDCVTYTNAELSLGMKRRANAMKAGELVGSKAVSAHASTAVEMASTRWMRSETKMT